MWNGGRGNCPRGEMRLEWWGFRQEGHGVRDGPPLHSVAPDLCQFLCRGEGLP